jgi:hypothetical protein
MIVPHAPYRRMEFRNEGTPFRGFGPHTHRKAPMEAQARFSEESCPLQQDRIKITAAQPAHYRQAKGNSRNLVFSVAIRLPAVNNAYRARANCHPQGGRRDT